MKLLRPHIPAAVRCIVAERQLRAAGLAWSIPDRGAASHRLALMLLTLFGKESPHLDHQPALMLRKKVFRNGIHVDYDPPANSAEHLIYRSKEAHRVKTFVRGDGAQFSDTMLRAKERKREKKRRSPRHKIAQRRNPWPKRKLQSRNSFQ